MPRILPLPSTPTQAVIETACHVVADGGVLAIPTESFYALAASASQSHALRRVNDIKGRPAGKPLLLLIAETTQLRGLVADIPPAAQVLMHQLWPGPLTLIFPALSGLSSELTAGTDTIGVRQPDVPALVPLLKSSGPLTGTSANRSGDAPVTSAEKVAQALGEAVDLILDGGETAGGSPSTLVDTRGPIRLVREGAVMRARIEAVLQEAGMALSPSR